MSFSDEIQTLLRAKSEDFERRVWERGARSGLNTYDDTSGLPPGKRGNQIRALWPRYVERQLIPLVHEAVQTLSKSAKNYAMVCGSILQDAVPKWKTLIEDRVAIAVIRPAAEQTRQWFFAACEGEGRMYETWLPPMWLSYHPKTFLQKRQAELRDSLDDELAQALAGNNGQLFEPQQGVTNPGRLTEAVPRSEATTRATSYANEGLARQKAFARAKAGAPLKEAEVRALTNLSKSKIYDTFKRVGSGTPVRFDAAMVLKWLENDPEAAK